jgi:uncharacterized membrane protein
MINYIETLNPYFNNLLRFLSSEFTKNPLAWSLIGILYFAVLILTSLYILTKNRIYILFGFMGFLFGITFIIYYLYIL